MWYFVSIYYIVANEFMRRNRIGRLNIAVLKYHDMQLKFLNKVSCRYI